MGIGVAPEVPRPSRPPALARDDRVGGLRGKLGQRVRVGGTFRASEQNTT